MNSLLVGIEAKVYCLLIIAFLWVFQIKIPHPQWKKLRYVFFLSFGEVVLSIIQDVAGAFLEELYVHNVFNIISGLFCFVLFCFLYVYFLGSRKSTLTIYKRLLMLIGGLVFGCLGYFSSKYRVGTAIYISTFAIIVVFAVSQYKKIKMDNLTKLYNRYGMDEEIRQQLRQYAHDKNNSFYIIACDLDNFKHINDTWGHSEGDRALVLIAAALSKVSKMFDAEVFRIGGDEFVIITDTSEEGLATEVMDAVKHELDNVDFRDDFDIKISMGVALYDGVTPIDDLLNNADKKLYQAKRLSKNS